MAYKQILKKMEEELEMNKIKKQKQDFLKALKTVDEQICCKCGQKLPEDWGENE